MTHRTRDTITAVLVAVIATGVIWLVGRPSPVEPEGEFGAATTQRSSRHDTSAALGAMSIDRAVATDAEMQTESELPPNAVAPPSEVELQPQGAAIRIVSPAGAKSVEQT